MSERLETIELTADAVGAITDAAAGVEQDAIVVRPHQDNSGIPGMDELLRSLPRASTERRGVKRKQVNTSTPFAFEMRYAPDPGVDEPSERVLTLQYVGCDDRLSKLLERQIPDKYPDSRAESRPATYLDPDPGDHLAAATLGLRRYSLYPLKNVGLDSFESDPTGSILTEMVGAATADDADADVAVQIMVRPAGTDWQDGVPGGYGLAETYGDGLTKSEKQVTSPLSTEMLRTLLKQDTLDQRPILPTPVGTALGYAHPFFRDEFTHSPSKADKVAAKMLGDLDGRGWEFHVRIVAVSPSADLAQKRVASTAEMFDNFYEYRGRQTFLTIPQNGGDAVDVATQAAGREWPAEREQRMVKPQIETAGLVNIPEAEHVSTNKLRWTLSSPGEGIPPRTPRFDFEAHGVADASQAARQVAMLDEASVGDPYWYGWGSRYGVAAGVTPETLRTHQFVGGGTGMGKTTWLKNFASQVMQRGHGALIIDPKGKDADEFIREWPEDRDREDFVFVDLSDEYDKQVRFNFMEVPGDAAPESRAFASTVEALCDDLASMVALAGGQDNYWGARMDRVIRTFIRGMAKSGKTCTLLDLAALCTAEENRERFTEWMDAERLEFIRRTAQRIEGFDDADLEPLAGRLDQWIQNDAIRDLISARESTVSIHDVVAEGKVVVVRNAPSSGSTEKRLFATALIRRVWVAAREVTDRPPFYIICDEFDSVVSEQSDIASILSEARAFDCSLTLACQNPSNQLPDRIQKAIENQCETFITFNPGGVDDARLIAAQHSPDVEKADLTNLSKYKFYMRTHDADDELTHSYKVDAFPPIEEVREEATGKTGRTDAELQTLKRESVERYGAEVESPAQQRQSSHFYTDADGEAADGTVPAASDSRGSDESAQQALCKAACDASLHAGGDGTDWADARAVCDRLERYTAREWTTAQFGGLADQTEGVEYRDSADGEEIRCTDAGRERFLPAGSNQTEGGLSHRSLLRDSYGPLTRLGLEVELPEQSGGREPDGIARIRESFNPPEDATPAEIASAVAAFEDDHPFLYTLTDATDAHIEAECSTGSGKPAATVENLAKAVDADRRCLFVCRPETAGDVYSTLAEPPLLHPNPGAFDRRFYNRKRLQVEGTRPLRPAGAEQSVWVEDNSEIVLRDSEGREHARFDAVDDVFKSADAYPARADTVDDAAIGRGETWRPIAKPYIPERELPGGRNADYSDAWTVLVLERPGASDGDGATLRRFDASEPVGDAGLPSEEGASDGGGAADTEGDGADDDFWGTLPSGGD